MRKLFTAAAVSAAMLAAAAAAPAWSADAEVSWKVGSPVGPNDPTTLNMQEVANQVAARTGGKFQIEIVPLETIGFKNIDELRVLKQGVLDAVYLVPYYLSRDEPLLAAMMPHGALIDPDDNLKIKDVQYEIAKEILEGDKWQLKMIAPAPFGALSEIVAVTNTPVNSLEGLRKLKFRHFTKAGLQAFNALGVSTQVIPSSELYLALQTGVLDGSVYGPTYLKSQSIYEVACCYAYIGAFTASYPFSLVSTAKAWDALPEDFRKVLVEVNTEMNAKSWEGWATGADEKAADAFLAEKGMKKLEPYPLADREAIQAAMFKVWAEEAEKIGPKAVENMNRIIEALKSGKSAS